MAKISARLQIEYCSPHELRRYAYNAKTHPKRQIQKLAKSIKKFGFNNPVLISDDKEIIGGVGRVEAAKQIGLELIPTVRLSSLTLAERLAYSLADNRLAEFGRYDRKQLAIELEELTNLGFDEIEVTGFSLGDTDAPPKEASEKADSPLARDDELPAPRTVVVSRKGDLWLLGSHRLLCGDATSAADQERLMDGQQADMVITDPGRHRHAALAMANGETSAAAFAAVVASSLRLAKTASRAGAILFVFVDWQCLLELLSAAQVHSLRLISLIVWAKPNAAMGGFYRSQHELIAVLKNGDAAHRNAVKRGQRGRHRSDLWTYASGGSFHAGGAEEREMLPTCKPVALVADAIRDVSRRGAIVFDPFAGSGSTLIAAEKTGRTAYLLEGDPRHCDVIIRRFEAYTGKKAQLDGAGLTFEETENTRSTAFGRRG